MFLKHARGLHLFVPPWLDTPLAHFPHSKPDKHDNKGDSICTNVFKVLLRLAATETRCESILLLCFSGQDCLSSGTCLWSELVNTLRLMRWTSSKACQSVKERRGWRGGKMHPESIAALKPSGLSGRQGEGGIKEQQSSPSKVCITHVSIRVYLVNS